MATRTTAAPAADKTADEQALEALLVQTVRKLLPDALKEAVSQAKEAGDLDGIIEDTTEVINAGGSDMSKTHKMHEGQLRIIDLTGLRQKAHQKASQGKLIDHPHFAALVHATSSALSGMGNHDLVALERLYTPDDGAAEEASA